MSEKPDKVVLYDGGEDVAHSERYRWRRVDGDNGEPLSRSTEGYEDASYAEEQARKLNPGCEIYREVGGTLVRVP